MQALPPNFYTQDVDAVAQALIGVTLTVDGVGGPIVETEAYDAADPASHSFVGRTRRNAAMFGPVGRAYVYRIYGLHRCVNIVCGTPGSAVLIRAIEPRFGLDVMRQRRGLEMASRLLCSGPGRLCTALAIDLTLDGASLNELPFLLTDAGESPQIMTGPRIGISKAADRMRRYGLKHSPWLSRQFPDESAALHHD
ncbi:DNA-3-methyladenine glycosylase [Sphingomonas sp. Marseille-Q8236]